MNLDGCIAEHSCTNIIKKSIPGTSLTPWVSVAFGNTNNVEITVGNQSSPPGNHAVIKSFQYGQSCGTGCRLEILDEEGGEFQLFVDKLWKKMEETGAYYDMVIQFGWYIKNCDGSTDIRRSPFLKFIPTHIESVIESGKIKFTVVSTDVGQLVFSSRFTDVLGTSTFPMKLKDAIRQLCIQKEPKLNVQFVDKKLIEWDFKGFPGGGPPGYWQSDGQNKIATIMKWVEPFMTTKNKGIAPVIDNSANDSIPTLYLFEDPKSGCNETVDCSESIGTYFVNSGKESPVISFQPKINWVTSMSRLSAATGNSGGFATGAVEQKKKFADTSCPDIQTPETGIQTSNATNAQGIDAHGMRDAPHQQNLGQLAHSKANGLRIPGIGGASISAELRIQGDPSPELSDPKRLLAQTVSLIVVNPFYIGDSSDSCGQWLANPACNDYLSNKYWRINGVDHTIKEGSYVTTLSLTLDAPGADIPEDSPLGGIGSGGATL